MGKIFIHHEMKIAQTIRSLFDIQVYNIISVYIYATCLYFYFCFLSQEIETNNIKKLIREHANLSPVLRKAVHDVVIKNKSVINVATDHKLDIELLQLKIHILKNKEKYLQRKIKYEAAVKFVYKKK